MSHFSFGENIFFWSVGWGIDFIFGDVVWVLTYILFPPFLGVILNHSFFVSQTPSQHRFYPNHYFES
jgi:hypothetical protein